MKQTLSIIIPCYNEEKSIDLFYHELKPVLLSMDFHYEMIFINDGSRDETLTNLLSLSEKDEHISIISLSRNFGKESAIYAGLQHAVGDLVVLMDADLQHPPHLLKAMTTAIIEEGYDGVSAYRKHGKKGKDPFFRRLYSKLFYRFINRVGDVHLVSGSTDYRMINRKVVNALLDVNEYNRFSKGLFEWVGFKTKYIPYENVERVAGKSSWNFFKLLNYALEGITSFSTAPLRFASYIGLISSVGAFIYMIFVIVRRIIDPASAVEGFPTLISVVLFFGGLILISLGILGEYIGRIYNEVKQRPIYLIDFKIESNVKGRDENQSLPSKEASSESPVDKTKDLIED